VIRSPEGRRYMAAITWHSPLSPYLVSVIVEAPNTIYQAAETW